MQALPQVLLRLLRLDKKSHTKRVKGTPVRGFWQRLIDDKLLQGDTLSVVAPMADVSDIAFRTMIAKYSKPHGPDVMWTEFVSADGLNSPGREVLKRDLEFTDIERPIVAQLFSSNPERMRKAAEVVADLGFDGIDINTGCPDKTVEKQKTQKKSTAGLKSACLLLGERRQESSSLLFFCPNSQLYQKHT